jgi:predicted metal-dependent phosphoesterase TrpH
MYPVCDTGKLIDLHTHTYESDGTLSPRELIDAAVEAELESLGITDHDTFAGYDAALPYARERGLDVVCGIELSCKEAGHTTHLLGYFLREDPGPRFRGWLDQLLEARRDRNRRLTAKLQSVGVDIQLAEVEKMGRSLTGRPHFAKVLVQKGYVATREEAFRRYIGEEGEAFVERTGPSVAEGIVKIAEAGGVASLAHPIRVFPRHPERRDQLIRALKDAGMGALEVWHADHSAREVHHFQTLAHRYSLMPTGGSDFHGEAKPAAHIGTGMNNNLNIPRSVLDHLRARFG